MIKQLPTSSREGLSNDSSNEEIFNASKYEYKTALKNSGYQQNKLIFSKTVQRKQKLIRHRNIIWFNPPLSRNVTTNVAKRFLNLLDILFPKSNKFHKIFNRNTVKVSHCCTENLLSIIKTRNKKVTNEKVTPTDQSKTGTTAHLMVTAKQLILYKNALPQPPLIQTKHT